MKSVTLEAEIFLRVNSKFVDFDTVAKGVQQTIWVSDSHILDDDGADKDTEIDEEMD